MSDAKSIIFTLTSFWKTRNTAFRPIRVKYLSATSQDLVTIRLMTDIPDELIVRSIKYVVKRHSQFYYSETRSEVTISDF